MLKKIESTITRHSHFNCNNTVWINKEITPLSCIEWGYHWSGNVRLLSSSASGGGGGGSWANTDTPKECQEICKAVNECHWFNWHDKKHPSGCWFLTRKGSKKNLSFGHNLGATGPKNC